ncbi:MAG TPA: hypothetical protein VGC95_05320 [Chitinophagaceae bacterium]|jgi:hypothetical protein
MMPLSFSGFGPVAIMLMILCLVVSQSIKYFMHRRRHTGKKASV